MTEVKLSTLIRQLDSDGNLSTIEDQETLLKNIHKAGITSPNIDDLSTLLLAVDLGLVSDPERKARYREILEEASGELS